MELINKNIEKKIIDKIDQKERIGSFGSDLVKKLQAEIFFFFSLPTMYTQHMTCDMW